jgi:Flavodoxin
MASVIIYPDRETKRTAKRLAKHLGAETIHMYKVSKKETSQYESYDNVLFGYTMVDHKRSKVLSEFCYLNKNRLKDMPSILFCPLINSSDAEIMERFMKTFSVFIEKYQQQTGTEKNMVVCSLNEKDRGMAAAVSRTMDVSYLDIKAGVLDMNTTSVIIVFYKTNSSLPGNLAFLMDPLISILTIAS